jgi:hypothetical protein
LGGRPIPNQRQEEEEPESDLAAKRCILMILQSIAFAAAPEPRNAPLSFARANQPEESYQVRRALLPGALVRDDFFPIDFLALRLFRAGEASEAGIRSPSRKAKSASI